MVPIPGATGRPRVQRPFSGDVRTGPAADLARGGEPSLTAAWIARLGTAAVSSPRCRIALLRAAPVLTGAIGLPAETRAIAAELAAIGETE